MFLNLHLLAPNCFLSPVHWCPLDRCSPLLLCPFSARFNPSRSAPHVSFTPFAHMSPPCAATSSPSCWLYIYYHVSRFIGEKTSKCTNGHLFRARNWVCMWRTKANEITSHTFGYLQFGIPRNTSRRGQSSWFQALPPLATHKHKRVLRI